MEEKICCFCYIVTLRNLFPIINVCCDTVVKKKEKKGTQFNQEQKRLESKKRGGTEGKKASESLLCGSGEVLWCSGEGGRLLHLICAVVSESPQFEQCLIRGRGYTVGQVIIPSLSVLSSPITSAWARLQYTHNKLEDVESLEAVRTGVYAGLERVNGVKPPLGSS